MSRLKRHPAVWLFALVAVAASVGYAYVAESGQYEQAFKELTTQGDVVYLLANSSVIMGPDVSGQSEEITFTGPVHVPKFPQPGFDRRQLDDGKYQIDFELTRSDLYGESYLMGGTVHLGEHPDLPSYGTITQRVPGQDYPSDFIVQRKVLIETPGGVLYNEDPVPVRGTIDSIPPVRQHNTPTDVDVFRGEQLPVAMLNQEGDIGGWFYSKAHLAFALNPVTVYRTTVVGEVGIRIGDEEEIVSVEGPMEFLEIPQDDAARTVKTELVKLGLRGDSRLLGGPIMLTELFSDKHSHSAGSLGFVGGEKVADNGQWDLYLDIKSPAGVLLVEQPLIMNGRTALMERWSEVDLGKRMVPVFGADLDYSGSAVRAMLDEADRPVGAITSLSIRSAEVHGQRPCCPREGNGTATAHAAAGAGR